MDIPFQRHKALEFISGVSGCSINAELELIIGAIAKIKGYNITTAKVTGDDFKRLSDLDEFKIKRYSELGEPVKVDELGDVYYNVDGTTLILNAAFHGQCESFKPDDPTVKFVPIENMPGAFGSLRFIN